MSESESFSVNETVLQFERQIYDKNVALRVDVPQELAPIETDADRLKQVIINLIGNAVKFTEEGSVTVRVEADAESRRPVRIEVIDTGIGIPRDRLEGIFDAFQQVDASATRSFEGTGLGLTISRSLCHLMGYRIEVASEVGRGSTFSICLIPDTKEG